MKKLLLSLVLIFLFSCIIFFLGSFYKLFGSLEGPGVIQGGALPVEVIQDKADRINKVKGNLSVENSKQILFGDLHVHTTYSTDAFMWSLPFFNGLKL